MNLFRSTALGLALTTALAGVPLGALAAQDPNASGDPTYKLEAPPVYAMMGDLLVARPFLIAATAVGTAAFVVSLPFTVLGGNVGEAAEAMVASPAREAFARCLGCTESHEPYTADQPQQ